MVHTERDAGSVFVWFMFKNLSLVHNEGVLCITCAVASSYALSIIPT